MLSDDMLEIYIWLVLISILVMSAAIARNFYVANEVRKNAKNRLNKYLKRRRK